jgi:hypothetical protein
MPNFTPAQNEGYPFKGSHVWLTCEAREVLKLAKTFSEQTGERYITNEHVLLALVNFEHSTVHFFLQANSISPEFIAKKLRNFLGLTNDAPAPLSPRLRAYQLYAIIECGLKDAVLGTLRLVLNDKWWAEGVPLKTRQDCVKTREEEDCILSPESYLYLVSYKEIIKHNWAMFGMAMERASGEKGKDKATGWMNTLNPVRNAVMHPGKREIEAEDLDVLTKAQGITSAFVKVIRPAESE